MGNFGKGSLVGNDNGLRNTGVRKSQVKKKKVYVTIQKPVIIKKYVDIEEEIIIERPVPHKVYEELDEEVINEIPIERIIEKPVEIIVEKKVEIIIEKEVPFITKVEKRIERIVEVPYEVIKNINVEKDYVIDKHIHRLVLKPYEDRNVENVEIVKVPVTEDKIVTKTEHYVVPVVVNKKVEIMIPREIRETIDKGFIITRYVEVIEDEINDIMVPVPVDRFVPKVFIIDRYIENIEEEDNIIKVPVAVYVDHEVEKPFIIERHIETIEDKIDNIPIKVKIYEEVDKEVDVFRPVIEPEEVYMPVVKPVGVDYNQPAQYQEDYKELVDHEDLPYPQYKIYEQPEAIDIHVEIEKIKEIPVIVEQFIPKEYTVERIIEVPKEVIVDKLIIVEKVVEVPKLNKIYEDKIIKKTIQVHKEKIIEKIVQVPVETFKDFDVRLTNVSKKIKISEKHQQMPLNKLVTKGVLPHKQKSEYEMLSKELAKLHFKKEKLTHQIKAVQIVDLGVTDFSLQQTNERNLEMKINISQEREDIRRMEMARKTLRKNVTIAPKVKFEKIEDDSTVPQLESDLMRIRQLNQDLKDFLVNKAANKHVIANYREGNRPVYYDNQRTSQLSNIIQQQNKVIGGGVIVQIEKKKMGNRVDIHSHKAMTTSTVGGEYRTSMGINRTTTVNRTVNRGIGISRGKMGFNSITTVTQQPTIVSKTTTGRYSNTTYQNQRVLNGGSSFTRVVNGTEVRNSRTTGTIKRVFNRPHTVSKNISVIRKSGQRIWPSSRVQTMTAGPSFTTSTSHVTRL